MSNVLADEKHHQILASGAKRSAAISRPWASWCRAVGAAAPHRRNRPIPVRSAQAPTEDRQGQEDRRLEVTGRSVRSGAQPDGKPEHCDRHAFSSCHAEVASLSLVDPQSTGSTPSHVGARALGARFVSGTVVDRAHSQSDQAQVTDRAYQFRMTTDILVIRSTSNSRDRSNWGCFQVPHGRGSCRASSQCRRSRYTESPRRFGQHAVPLAEARSFNACRVGLAGRPPGSTASSVIAPGNVALMTLACLRMESSRVTCSSSRRAAGDTLLVRSY